MKKTARRIAEFKWLRWYTALYLLVALPMLACLLVSGKTLLWRADAFYQHYTALNFTGETIHALLSGEGFSMVNLSLGQGLDSITTMAYYGLFDPFQWPAALLTGKGLEIYYHVLIFAYMYLSGLFFCIFARKIRLGGGDRAWAAVAAGLTFAFCGYNTIGVIKHPYFGTGGMYLALMLIAVERILQDRKWLMMCLVTALMLLSNFYFAFQTTVLTVVYIIIRLIARIGRKGVKKNAADGFILLGSYLLGLAISMAVLLPVAITFLESSRASLTGGYTESLLAYPLEYYVKLLLLAFAPYDYAGYWSLQSFSPVALFSLMLLFARGKKSEFELRDSARVQLRAGFAFCFICMCIPLAGKVFNGFGYVANRWSYGYAFVMSAITLWALPQIMHPDFPLRRKLAVAGIAWAIVMLGYGVLERNVGALAGGMAVAAAALFLLVFEKRIRLENDRMKRLLVVLTGVCCLAYTIGYPVVAMTDGEFYSSGLKKKLDNETAAVVSEIEDDGFYRVDTGNWNDCHATIHDYNSTSYYWSLIPQHVSGHYVNLEQSTLRWTFRLEGLGSDPYLEALAGVGYALRPVEENTVSLPYGFEKHAEVQQADGDTIAIYKNQYALPFAYVFNNVISESEYDALGPVEKRQALISAAVLEDAEQGLEAYSEGYDVVKTGWEVVSMDGAQIIGNEIHAQEDGMITLRFQAVPDSTAYLHMKNVELLELSKGNGLISTDNSTDLTVRSLTEAGTGRMYVIRRDGVFNYDQQGSCICLGYSQQGIGECILRFTADSVISFDEMEILHAPMEAYRNAAEKLRSSSWNGEFDGNGIRGTFSLDAPGILQFSLPYGKGWTASVDGTEAEVLRCGGMYMGLKLDAGAHEVQLRYETPGLRMGICISIVAVVLTAVLRAACAVSKRKRA